MDQLVMNRLPFPKYYDGVEWNTQFKPTRKSIPKYLHNQLPALKHIYIKQKFKEIGKFNCPKLEYFDKIIKNPKKEIKPVHKSTEKKHKNEVPYEELKQELQYALIIADSKSNIVDGLLQKAKSCRKSPHGKTKRTKRERNLSLVGDTGKYFSNTVELVFRQRRKQFLEQLKQQPEIDFSEAEQKVNTIKLLSFDK